MLKERPLRRPGDSPLFVANRSELERAKACVGRGFNLAISGAAGSGKSSLLAQLAISERSNQHEVYAAGADSAAGLIDAIAEDIVGPPSRRRSQFEAVTTSLYGKLETAPTNRGRIVSSIDRVANYLERDLDDTVSPAEQPLILVDRASRRAVQELFGGFSDLLAKIDAVWAVCVQGDVSGGPTNPAPRFFDEHIHLDPPSFADIVAVVASRTNVAADLVEKRLAVAGAQPMELRSVIALARQLDAGVPVGRDEFEGSRRAAQKQLATLGRPAAMLVAEMQHLGPVSPSDERLLARMGWKRARASEMLSKLSKLELVRYTERVGPEGGRPRRVYELIPELQS